ncbi:MAG: peroxiredoxin family protein [Candidatus Omnitrophota bacterium]
MKKAIILSAAMVYLLGASVSFVYAGGGGGSSECASVASLGTAADFSLSGTGGENISLKGLRGKDVILFFWASWCPNCLREISVMNDIYRKLEKDNTRLLAISVGEDPDKIRRFAQRRKLDFPVFLDGDQVVASSYRIFGIPTYFVVDKQGEIRFRGHYFPGDYKKYVCGK